MCWLGHNNTKIISYSTEVTIFGWELYPFTAILKNRMKAIFESLSEEQNAFGLGYLGLVFSQHDDTITVLNDDEKKVIVQLILAQPELKSELLAPLSKSVSDDVIQQLDIAMSPDTNTSEPLTESESDSDEMATVSDADSSPDISDPFHTPPASDPPQSLDNDDPEPVSPTPPNPARQLDEMTHILQTMIASNTTTIDSLMDYCRTVTAVLDTDTRDQLGHRICNLFSELSFIPISQNTIFTALKFYSVLDICLPRTRAAFTSVIPVIDPIANQLILFSKFNDQCKILHALPNRTIAFVLLRLSYYARVPSDTQPQFQRIVTQLKQLSAKTSPKIFTALKQLKWID
jgi:hypothetical protein